MQNAKIKIFHSDNRGFSLVELLVGVAVLSVVAVAVYNSYSGIFKIVYDSRAKLDAVDLANEQLEIARNLPYSQVGIAGGIPTGTMAHLQTVTRDSATFTVTTTVRNIEDPFDGTLGGAPNDTSPADYKLVEVILQNNVYKMLRLFRCQ